MNNTQNDHVREGSPAMLDRLMFLLLHNFRGGRTPPRAQAQAVRIRPQTWGIVGSAPSRCRALGSACRT